MTCADGVSEMQLWTSRLISVAELEVVMVMSINDSWMLNRSSSSSYWMEVDQRKAWEPKNNVHPYNVSRLERITLREPRSHQKNYHDRKKLSRGDVSCERYRKEEPLNRPSHQPRSYHYSGGIVFNWSKCTLKYPVFKQNLSGQPWHHRSLHVDHLAH